MAGAPAREGRLPAEVTSFEGRDDDVAEVKRLVATTRVVTVAGTGGIGKTRLALHAAHRLRRSFPGGVRFVDLAAVTDPSHVARETAAAVGVADSTTGAIAEHLLGHRTLLVLDNCEHVLEACAEFVDHVVRMTDRLRVLCTSRQPLAALGEHVWALSPLAVPPEEVRLTVDAVTRYPALTLFSERAVAATPDFALCEENLDVAADVCRQTDGIPLGLELAAAQLRYLSLDQVRDAMATNVLSLSTRRSTPAWHGSLKSACDRDFALCTPDEKLLWSRLSVFTGDFDIDAAISVCGAGLSPDAVLAAVAGLVDRSVLSRNRFSGRVRYRLTKTFRQYGRTASHFEVDALRGRHLRWYLRLAERAEADWSRPGGQERAFTSLRAEHANLCAAVRGSLGTRDALRLAGALWFYWAACGFPSDVLRGLVTALAEDQAPGDAHTKALLAVGVLAMAHGDVDCAVAALRDCCDRPFHSGNAHVLAHALVALSCTEMLAGHHERARSLLATAIERYREPDVVTTGELLAKAKLAFVDALLGDTEEADALCADVRAACTEQGDTWTLAMCHYVSAVTSFLRGEVDRAAERAKASLRAQHELHNLIGIRLSLELLAGIGFERGSVRRAVTLLSASEQVGHAVGAGASLLAGCAEWSGLAHRALGDHGYGQAVREGASLTLDDAVSYALHDTPRAAAGERRRADVFDELTRREREVCELIALGLTNKQIAARLRIAQRTAEGYVENILRKLAVSSRTQVAVLVSRKHQRPA